MGTSPAPGFCFHRHARAAWEGKAHYRGVDASGALGAEFADQTLKHRTGEAGMTGVGDGVDPFDCAQTILHHDDSARLARHRALPAFATWAPHAGARYTDSAARNAIYLAFGEDDTSSSAA